MKVGIDSYCFHRFFGEVYPQQQTPERSMTLEDFIEFAKTLAVDGVSLESCFFPSVEPSYLADIRAMLDPTTWIVFTHGGIRTVSKAARTRLPTKR